MCRRAWQGNGLFYCRKARCATNWLPSRKLAKPTVHSERHSAHQGPALLKVCSPLLKKWHVCTVAWAAPRQNFRKCQLPRWESDNYSPPATCLAQPYMSRAWAATGVPCKNNHFLIGKVTIRNNGSLRSSSAFRKVSLFQQKQQGLHAPFCVATAVPAFTLAAGASHVSPHVSGAPFCIENRPPR